MAVPAIVDTSDFSKKTTVFVTIRERKRGRENPDNERAGQRLATILHVSTMTTGKERRTTRTRRQQH
jgi:hypothetical protein